MFALAALLHVSPATVYTWFNRWEQGGLAGLANAKYPDRPAILQAANRERVEAAVRTNHQQAMRSNHQKLKEMTAALRQELNNARILHSATFQARLQGWEDQDLHLFYLPTYSLHLNKVEILWRQIKYEWLRPEAYTDFKTLKTAVWHALDRVGLKCTIQFAP